MGSKVYVDANVLLDYLQDRPNEIHVEKIFLQAHEKGIELITSVINLAVIFYVERKRGFSRKEIYRSFNYINNVITVVDQSTRSYHLALKSKFSDFEDALQYFAALENNADFIITENKKDFKESVIPVLSSKEYVNHQL